MYAARLLTPKAVFFPFGFVCNNTLYLIFSYLISHFIPELLLIKLLFTNSSGTSSSSVLPAPPHLFSHLHPLVSAVACPVLCSGNGQYSKGLCMCYSGWKGLECDVPQGQCIDPSCGGRGTCTQGSCACEAGYRGESCEEGTERVYNINNKAHLTE